METIDDILREMCALGQLDEKSTDKIPRSLQALGLRTYAKRIKAAHKHETVKDCHALNAAAAREALEAARDLLLPQCNGGTAFAKACGETVNKIMDALSAPPRNCDIGTAGEQEERYIKFKREHVDKLERCPAVGHSFFPDSLYWAQMPYESGAKG